MSKEVEKEEEKLGQETLQGRTMIGVGPMSLGRRRLGRRAQIRGGIGCLRTAIDPPLRVPIMSIGIRTGLPSLFSRRLKALLAHVNRPYQTHGIKRPGHLGGWVGG